MNPFAKEEEYGILVNKDNPLSEDYVPEELVPVVSKVKTFRDPNYKLLLHPAALVAFERLKKLAAKFSCDLQISSGYRSYEYQEFLLNEAIKEKGDDAHRTVAHPGCSEHQTGLAIDYKLYSPKKLAEMNLWESTVFRSKLLISHSLVRATAHKFGFIERYPKGTEHLTGFVHEPWHLRYVGENTAKIMRKGNLIHEQYHAICSQMRLKNCY